MAQRTNLREFQQALITRMEATGATAAVSARLGFRLGDQHWLVDLTSIDEVLPVPPLDAVPLTKPWYAGVANIRGSLYSVIDLALFCGLPATEITRASRILLIKSHLLGGSALLVSAIAGLRNPAQFRFEHAAGVPWIRGQHHEHHGALEQRTWTEIDIQALASQREFFEVAI